ncbi:MAG: mechanosensitive ion channel family protein [Archaeoglobaceae archaeon]|nr:mechanosensitive ion channel family protein [Archaeoglobaceae archaeon]MDW8118138.1 mechanosensitive ion channel family protein [Archaeoglobaceae archaeon]
MIDEIFALTIKAMDYEIYENVTVRDLIFASIVIIIAFLIAKFIAMSLRRSLADKLKKDQLELLIKLIYTVIIVIAFASITPVLGFNLTGLLVAGGIAGIVIGFASQKVVSNLISGLFLIAERPIKIGDQIVVGNIAGFVEDMNIMSTIVRTYDGQYVRIPNETLFTSNITNPVANVARRFEYTISIRYSDDADKAIQIIRKVIEEHPFALKIPPPRVFVDNLGDSGVNIVARIWAPSNLWLEVKTDLLWKIKVELENNGIQIPFPQRVLWFGKELESKTKQEQ